MKKNTRIILLCVIGVLIIITIVIGVTYSFMRPINETSSETKVSLNACANLTLKDTDTVVELSNSYPMSKNKALQTTPYTFTLTSSCGDRTAYSIYLATLNTNTLADNNIHYILTKSGTKEIITEGILSDATNALSDFNTNEQNELNTGINGTFSKIYKIYFNGISKDEEQEYDLYLYVDESVTDPSTMNKTFKAGVAAKIQDYTFATVNNITVTGTTTSSISISVNASGGTNSVATYYYSINNGSYTSSSSNTYTFSGLNKGTTYTIKVYVKDTNGVDSSVYTISAETENLTYICTTGTNLATCIKSQYTSQGANGIYYHTSSLANSAEDNSYRYAGANPNNYVCFGSDESPCPEDNLYRIIGVFDDEVKLIKATSNGVYAWGISDDGYVWSTSSIRTLLNTTYYNTLSSAWQNKIETHTWKVGGMTANLADAKQYYDMEVGSSSSSTTDSIKIGLMYVSDYGFASDYSDWTIPLSYYFYDDSYSGNNWLYLGSNEWTISREENNQPFGQTDAVFRIYYGSIRTFIKPTVGDSVHVHRPCFYLTSVITYVSGSSTSTDPIRIN